MKNNLSPAGCVRKEEAIYRYLKEEADKHWEKWILSLLKYFLHTHTEKLIIISNMLHVTDKGEPGEDEELNKSIFLSSSRQQKQNFYH